MVNKILFSPKIKKWSELLICIMGSTSSILKGTHFLNFYLAASWPHFRGIIEGNIWPSNINHLCFNYFDPKVSESLIMRLGP